MSTTGKISMSDIYDQYIDYYNQAGKKMKHHIPVLSEFKNIEKSFSERIDDLKEDFEKLIINLEEILDKKIEKTDRGKSNYNAKNLRKSKNEILSKLRYYIYFDRMSSFEQQKEYIFSLLSRFYDKNETDVEFEMIKIFIKVSKEEIFKFKNIQLHEVVIANLRREIIDNFYPDQLDFYEDLSEKEKDQIYESGNANKLYVASDWLTDIVNDINDLDNPTHKQILDRLKQDFPDFEDVPDEIELSFTKGHNNINKSSIDKALTYLFNKKHDINIKKGTIKRRMDDYGVW